MMTHQRLPSVEPLLGDASPVSDGFLRRSSPPIQIGTPLKSIEGCLSSIDDFSTELISQFGAAADWSLVGEFKRLKQSSSVSAYQERFEHLRSLILRVNPSLSESYFVASFISGLEDDIQHILLRLQPTTLSHAFRLARLEETANEARRRQSKQKLDAMCVQLRYLLPSQQSSPPVADSSRFGLRPLEFQFVTQERWIEELLSTQQLILANQSLPSVSNLQLVGVPSATSVAGAGLPAAEEARSCRLSQDSSPVKIHVSSVKPEISKMLITAVDACISSTPVASPTTMVMGAVEVNSDLHKLARGLLDPPNFLSRLDSYSLPHFTQPCSQGCETNGQVPSSSFNSLVCEKNCFVVLIFGRGVKKWKENGDSGIGSCGFCYYFTTAYQLYVESPVRSYSLVLST